MQTQTHHTKVLEKFSSAKLHSTFGGVLSSDGVFCLLRINRGIELSESSDSSLGISSKNLLSGLQMNMKNKFVPFYFAPPLPLFFFLKINPLTPKSDQNLISPYNITPESHIKVTRKKEMIINNRRSRLLNKFSLSAP